MAESVESALDDARAAKDAGADIVEFRVDRLFDPGDETGGELSVKRVERLCRETPLPCIVTCRPVSEGGEYDGEEAARIALFERLGALAGSSPKGAAGAPRFLDVELETYTRSANVRQKIHLAVANPGQLRDLETSLILSFHDFQGRPSDLMRKVARMRAEPASPDGAVAVHKIAYRGRSVRDNLELFDLLLERDRPTIALAMGEEGLLSRVLAPKFGGFLTFASLRPQEATAPGQPTVEELLSIYRFREIGPATRVYGVVGWPVAQSLSPLVQNAGFRTRDERGAPLHDGAYIPLPVPPEWEHFKATMLAFLDHPRLDFCGASVTIPHKEHALRLARDERWEIEPLASRIGAANTIAVEREPASGSNGSGASGGSSPRRVRVMNTDAPAVAMCLERAMRGIKGRRIALLGAGGVAAAAATALVDEGATVVIHNRTLARAEALASRVRDAMTEGAKALGGKVVAAAWEKRCGSCCEAFINCTPLGMRGGGAENESPLPEGELEHAAPGTVVMDTVYNPPRTPLILSALKNNLPTVDGVSMFAAQAEAQFRAWTGRAAPVGLFERLVRERLAKS